MGLWVWLFWSRNSLIRRRSTELYSDFYYWRHVANTAKSPLRWEAQLRSREKMTVIFFVCNMAMNWNMRIGRLKKCLHTYIANMLCEWGMTQSCIHAACASIHSLRTWNDVILSLNPTPDQLLVSENAFKMIFAPILPLWPLCLYLYSNMSLCGRLLVNYFFCQCVRPRFNVCLSFSVSSCLFVCALLSVPSSIPPIPLPSFSNHSMMVSRTA